LRAAARATTILPVAGGVSADLVQRGAHHAPRDPDGGGSPRRRRRPRVPALRPLLLRGASGSSQGRARARVQSARRRRLRDDGGHAPDLEQPAPARDPKGGVRGPTGRRRAGPRRCDRTSTFARRPW
jgi:hypothetical protein